MVGMPWKAFDSSLDILAGPILDLHTFELLRPRNLTMMQFIESVIRENMHLFVILAPTVSVQQIIAVYVNTRWEPD